MTKAGQTGRSVASDSTRRDARAERLAAALKANLHRRKAQARERAAQADKRCDHAELTGAHHSAGVVDHKRSG